MCPEVNLGIVFLLQNEGIESAVKTAQEHIYTRLINSVSLSTEGLKVVSHVIAPKTSLAAY